MDIPLLKQGPFLVASIQTELSDAELNRFQESLVEAVGKHRIRGVIIDVTALDVVDSYGARTFRDVASMVKMRGSQMVIVGIQPQVAFTLVQLGLSLEGVRVALDLEEGLAYLRRQHASDERMEPTRIAPRLRSKTDVPPDTPGVR